MTSFKRSTMTRQDGVTLVELMISLALGLLIAIGLATLFSQNKRSFYQNEDLARMMEDGRHALDEMARDIAMAGFYAELSEPSIYIVSNAVIAAPDCRAANAVGTNPGDPGLTVNSTLPISWTYALFRRTAPPDAFRPEQGAIAVANNATAAQAVAEFPCLGAVAGTLEPGSDVFFTKRVAGSPTPTAELVANRVYIARRGTEGTLGLGNTVAAIPKAVGDPLDTDWEFQPKVYYVRNVTGDITGDGVAETVPTLCRQVLNPGPVFGEDCIAQGVERFQIEWGVDTSGDGDANAYVSALDAGLQNVAVADPNEVVTARIHLLMRSVRPDPSYTNTKTYQFADMPTLDPAADDRFYRRVLSTTVMVRNVQGMNLLAF